MTDLTSFFKQAIDYDPAHPKSNLDYTGDKHPTDYGFHCGTVCLDDQKAEASHHHWQFTDDRMYQAEEHGGVPWSTIKTADHPMPKQVHGMQDYLDSKVVDHYAKGGGPAEQSGDFIGVVKWGGKNFVHTGTHRMAAALQRGDTSYHGKFHDLDAEVRNRKQGSVKQAAGPLIFYPGKFGGKYHLTDPISETARCRTTVEVDRQQPPIHVQPDQEQVHPVICKRCLQAGRAAQDRGEHTAAHQRLDEYKLEHEQMFEGSHRIDAHHTGTGDHAGFAEFDPDGTLSDIEVEPEHQRKGLATSMWEHAKSIGINPQHSNVRSPEGDAWAHSTGDKTPDNVWRHGDVSPEHAVNQPFSTAFTAPGYYHPYTSADMPIALGYAPKHRRTGALHDISQPDYPRHEYGSQPTDEEREAHRQEYETKRDAFHKQIRDEAGLPEDTDRWEVENHWKRGMRHALTMGHINIDEAEKRGYNEGLRENGEKVSTYENYYDKDKQERKGGWQKLPKQVYHVSTNADAAAKEGLKTRHELGTGAGLGGGTDDTVSVTSDKSLGPDIYHSLHEHHAVVSGKISPQQLHDYAKNPPHGMTPFHEALVHPGTHEEEDFDRLKRGVTSNQHYLKDEPKPSLMTKSEAAEQHPDWTAEERSKVKGREGKEPLYTHWERPATDDEKTYRRSEFYKRFSTMRQMVGKGHRDPLFMSNDSVAFSKAKPENFGIMHLQSHEGAQGYPLHANQEHHKGADSGEWRMGSGSPFDVTHVERPTPRHEEEFKTGEGKTAMRVEATDWDQFDNNHWYRSGHQAGARGDSEYHDHLRAKVDMKIPLDPEDIDYLAGHAAGQDRGRQMAADVHNMKQIWEEHGKDYKTSAKEHHHESAEAWGGKEHWNPGETAHFEYHCYEGHDSADAQAWYHSHRKVKVLAPGQGDGWEEGYKDSTHAERAEDGVPRTYTVQHEDGFKHDAFEDELLTDPKHFYRPDPPSPPKTAAVKVHCADCGDDYFVDSDAEIEQHHSHHHHKTAHCGTCEGDLVPPLDEQEEQRQEIPKDEPWNFKEGRVRDVRNADSKADAQTGIMVAIVPPASIVENLKLEEGEAAEQIHLTLAYLGDAEDYSENMVENLPEIIEAWADGTGKFEATTQGAGTFVKAEEDGQHVLWAAIDAPGLHRLHVNLVDYLKEHGYEPSEDHVFTPHVTLAYGKYHFRFIPKVTRQTWKVREVWCCVGGIWRSFTLKG